jgi:hypothetical protein
MERMRRLRAGAYSQADYLIRYLGWLEGWDGVREEYRPWHIYRRASHIDSRILLESARTLDEAKAFVAAHLDQDRKNRGVPT